MVKIDKAGRPDEIHSNAKSSIRVVTYGTLHGHENVSSKTQFQRLVCIAVV